MSKRIVPSIDGYWTYAKVKKTYKIGEYLMLKLVACGLVRTKATAGFAPLFSVDDVEKCLKEIRIDDTNSHKGRRFAAAEAQTK